MRVNKFSPLICDLQLNSSSTQESIPRNHRIWHCISDYFLYPLLRYSLTLAAFCGLSVSLKSLEITEIWTKKSLTNKLKLTVLKFAPLCSQYVNLAFCGILLHLCQFWLSNKNLQNLRISDNDKWRQMMGDRKRCRSQLLEKLTCTEKDSIFLQEFSYYKCKSKIFIGKVS